MVAMHYRWDFYGLSTDSKPDATNEKVANGSTYYEADTSKLYVWYNDQWYEKEATGGGGGGDAGAFKILTSDDYNYPENNPTCVALWLLDPGTYYVNNHSSLTTVVKTNVNDYGTYYNTSLFIISELPQNNNKSILCIGNPNSAGGDGKNGIIQSLTSPEGYDAGSFHYVTYDELATIAPTNLNTGSYDFPASDPDGVSLWNLNEGEYKIDASESDPLNVYFTSSTNLSLVEATIKIKDIDNGAKKIIKFDYITTGGGYTGCESGWENITVSTGVESEMNMYSQESV